MNPPAVPPAVRAGIVARVMAKKSTAAAEAARYKIRPALVRGWVFEKRKEMKANAIAAASDPTKQDPTKANSAVPSEGDPNGIAMAADPASAARALAAMGVPAAGQPANPVVPNVSNAAAQAALAASEEEDKRFVLEGYRDAKEGALDPLISHLGLTNEHPLAKKILRIPMPTETVLKANATWIAPKIRDKTVGWLPLLVGLSIDVGVTYFAIRSAAVEVMKARLAEEEKKNQGGATA